MHLLNSQKKTPVTALALAIGLALQTGAVMAQDTNTSSQDSSVAPSAAAADKDVTSLTSVTVTGYRASVAKALDVKRGELGMVDAIMAEDVGKFPDLNLAESLQRIPGVVITRDAGEGRNITVRGLGPDFTRVRINGMEALTTVGSSDQSGGTNRSRGFDFNVFAADLFSAMIVRKTASADVEEGSLGATVDLNTARPFDYDGFTLAANAQASYGSMSEKTDPRVSALIANTSADVVWSPAARWIQAATAVAASSSCAQRNDRASSAVSMSTSASRKRPTSKRSHARRQVADARAMLSPVARASATSASSSSRPNSSSPDQLTTAASPTVARLRAPPSATSRPFS